MTAPNNKDGLFREDAVAALFKTERRMEAAALRISPRWLGWAFWLLVATCLGGGIYLVAGTVAVTAEGSAIVRVEDSEYGFVAVLPGDLRSQLRPGMPVQLRLEGRELPAVLSDIDESTYGLPEARAILGVASGGPAAVSSPMTVIRGELSGGGLRPGDDASGGVHGARATVSVALYRERLLVRVLPGGRARAAGDG